MRPFGVFIFHIIKLSYNIIGLLVNLCVIYILITLSIFQCAAQKTIALNELKQPKNQSNFKIKMSILYWIQATTAKCVIKCMLHMSRTHKHFGCIISIRMRQTKISMNFVLRNGSESVLCTTQPTYMRILCLRLYMSYTHIKATVCRSIILDNAKYYLLKLTHSFMLKSIISL